MKKPLAFSQENCGRGKFIRFEAFPGDLVRITGAKLLKPQWFKPVKSTDLLWESLDKKARKKCLKIDLKGHGIENFGKLRPRGGFDKKTSHAELFFNKKRIQLARWPNSDFAWTGEIYNKNAFEY